MKREGDLVGNREGILRLRNEDKTKYEERDVEVWKRRLV